MWHARFRRPKAAEHSDSGRAQRLRPAFRGELSGQPSLLRHGFSIVSRSGTTRCDCERQRRVRRARRQIVTGRVTSRRSVPATDPGTRARHAVCSLSLVLPTTQHAAEHYVNNGKWETIIGCTPRRVPPTRPEFKVKVKVKVIEPEPRTWLTALSAVRLVRLRLTSSQPLRTSPFGAAQTAIVSKLSRSTVNHQRWWRARQRLVRVLGICCLREAQRRHARTPCGFR